MAVRWRSFLQPAAKVSFRCASGATARSWSSHQWRDTRGLYAFDRQRGASPQEAIVAVEGFDYDGTSVWD